MGKTASIASNNLIDWILNIYSLDLTKNQIIAFDIIGSLISKNPIFIEYFP